MYSQLIYFVVVLLLFSVQRHTGRVPALSYSDAFYAAVLFLSFVLYCRASFGKILRAASRGLPPATLTRAFYRAQAQLSILAIGYLVFYLYGAGLRLYLPSIPGYDSFTTVSGSTGLIIYLVHMAVIWFWSHPAYQAIHGSQVRRLDFIKGQLSFSSVILAPWFLVSTIVDLLQFIKMPSFMSTDLGQITLLALALLGFVLFGPWLVVRIWRCKPLPQNYVRAELEAFCSQHDFRTGGLMLWPIFGGEMLTAAVVGILPRMRYVLITSGLLQVLDISEIKAVVAHEMGHVRKKHLLLFVLLFVLFIWLVYSVSDTFMLLALSSKTILRWSLTPGEFGSSVVSLLSALPVIVLMVIYFRFIFGFFLRNSERQADIFAMELVGSPRPLVSSLEKIAFRSGRIEDLPSWHHYSINQRIHFLIDAFNDRALIRKHNRKLYGSVLVFVALVSGLLFLNKRADESGLAKRLTDDVQMAILEQGISQEPENTEYQANYGGLLYEKGRYSEAESVLRAALSQDPNNASALNNLAWLYATSPPPFRNPPEALDLAIEAASLNPEPFILDTLAEAYFVNGRYAEALETINEALSKDGTQHSHYLKQKEKFEKALKGELRQS